MPIEIKDVSFGFDTMDHLLFEHTNVNIDSSWCLGLIGRNGRGKSTFLKLLMGEYPHTGKVSSDVSFVYFPQKILHEAYAVYHAIDEVMSVELWKLEKECQLLGLNKEIVWQPFEQLSGGEQTKVLLAALFCEGHRFPLLDEPTNHLDIEARETVATYLKKKNGFIVVSHDRAFVDKVVDHLLVIEKSNVTLYKGDYSTYEQQKALQDAFEIERNSALKSEISRLENSSKEKSNWANKREKPSGNDPFGNAVAKRMNKRAKAVKKRTQEKIEEKKQLLKNIETVNSLTINCQSTHRNPILRVKDFTLAYYDKPLFQPVTFNIFQHEQVALVGPNGSGKTTLLHYLLHQNFSGTVSGTIDLSKNLTLSSIRQQHHDNIGELKDFAEKHQIDYTLFLNNLRTLGVDRDVFQVPIEQMSSGQKKKVEFAKSLGLPAAFYIWDEPLNYLDVFNQAQIEKMILTYKPTLLFVEHDPLFVSNVASKIVELVPFH